MKLIDYKKLVDCKFLNCYTGGISWYWSDEERRENYNYEDIEAELMKQLTCDFDINNCIILFPLASGSGTTMLFDKGRIVIDHCTYILDIPDFLRSKGIVWKNGSKIKSNQSLYNICMIVVDNGLARIVSTANPLKGFSYHYKANSVLEKFYWNESDSNIELDNKEIFFSGFLVNRIQSNKK